MWMGWGMVRRPAHGLPDSSGHLHRSGRCAPSRPILGGVVFSITNPYWSLWWITVGAAFLGETQSLGLGILGITAFYLGHVLSDYSWFTLVSLAVASGRRVMGETFYKGVVLIRGLFLWGMAFVFILRGLNRIF